MIKFKPRHPDGQNDTEIKALSDKEGWVDLPSHVIFEADDFTIAYLKINDVIYSRPIDGFWDEYNKAKTWDMINDSI